MGDDGDAAGERAGGSDATGGKGGDGGAGALEVDPRDARAPAEPPGCAKAGIEPVPDGAGKAEDDPPLLPAAVRGVADAGATLITGPEVGVTAGVCFAGTCATGWAPAFGLSPRAEDGEAPEPDTAAVFPPASGRAVPDARLGVGAEAPGLCPGDRAPADLPGPAPASAGGDADTPPTAGRDTPAPVEADFVGPDAPAWNAPPLRAAGTVGMGVRAPDADEPAPNPAAEIGLDGPGVAAAGFALLATVAVAGPPVDLGAGVTAAADNPGSKTAPPGVPVSDPSPFPETLPCAHAGDDAETSVATVIPATIARTRRRICVVLIMSVRAGPAPEPRPPPSHRLRYRSAAESSRSMVVSKPAARARWSILAASARRPSACISTASVSQPDAERTSFACIDTRRSTSRKDSRVPKTSAGSGCHASQGSV